MTIDEAIHEIAELESTMPALPFKGDDERRSREMSQRLAALYDYMSERLLYANLHNSQPALDEVAGLLATLREAWAEIRSQVQPASV